MKRLGAIDDKVKKVSIKQARSFLLENYRDILLFGASITNPMFSITGPLQIDFMSKSIHATSVKLCQGIASFASSSVNVENAKSKATNWTTYINPYALCIAYMRFEKNVAIKNGIKVTEEIIQDFIRNLFQGLKMYRSISKNQMPRFLLEIIYKENDFDGELDYLKFQYNKKDTELRSITDITVDFSEMCEYYESKKDKIKKVNLYVHRKTIIDNVHEDWNIVKDI